MTRWLGLDFTGPERQYNPEIRDFLAELLVPRDYRDLLREYDNREQAFSGVRERFMATLEAVDEVVFDLFGPTPDERAHVKARLASFPLNRLRPRYPWEVGEPRPLRAYTEDRFR
jgi:hypothetical protein